ncbi:DUF3784 domain-containing protein [Methanosalsum natronophilum]|nr:DUF3784 domain-containing protein [Methanosalsum natronophilum]MCS3924781.1 putative membrane protein [Methanosalsum natronophilum]
MLEQLIFLFSGLMLIILGYLIAFKKKMCLISGYNENKVKNKHGLAKLVGYFTIILGLMTAIMPILIQYIGEHAIWIFSFVIIGGSILVILKAQKY